MTNIGSLSLRLALILALLGSGPVPAEIVAAGATTNLTIDQRRTIRTSVAAAHDLVYRAFTAIVDGRPCTVVLLGENHLAVPRDIATAKDVIDQFEHVATENGPFNDDVQWRYRTLNVARSMVAPSVYFSTRSSGRQLTSPMILARTGARVKTLSNAERLHQPNLAEEAQLLAVGASSLGAIAAAIGFTAVAVATVWPAAAARVNVRRVRRVAKAALAIGVAAEAANIVTGRTWTPLVKNRDVSISRFIAAWIGDAGSLGPLLVILGSLHLRNVGEILVNKYGFVENDLTEPAIP